ncbi:MAG: glycerol kinase, partial [Alphaproteobacteria bacterium]|nr:glycerol kinase [Alphaproteobacteria bacterium]
KIAWLLDSLPDARRRAEQGELAFGTVDSFIIWRLTGGKVHATDASNASRTLLYDIHKNAWDKELCGALGVPMAMLPDVRDSAGDFGACDASVMGKAIPIAGVAGDQQAATIGQACIEPGLVKSTYGTGTFALMNTGNRAVPSRNRLLTVLAWRLKGQTTYALEGSVFVSGATVQWLRDTVKLLPSAGESEQIATSIPDNRGVYLVPAFVGLGAPYWDPDARAAIFGMTRDTGPAEIIRAGLEAAAYSTRDLLDAMAADAATVGLAPKELRVDGGMAENAWLMQFLADIVGLPVDRPQVTETTALGAAALAGLGVGLLPRLTAVAAFRHPDKRWAPSMAAERSARLFEGWKTAVRRVLTR